MPHSVAMVSLGCAKNQINAEQMLFLLEEAGHRIVPADAQPDAVIVNTCGFIDSAKSEAIETILELAAIKRESGCKIIAAGCLPERYRQEMLDELPELDAVVGVGSFSEITAALDAVMSGGRYSFFGEIRGVDEISRVTDTSQGWAYLKIADGCDNRCAYCVIPSIRGPYHSRPMEHIISEAEHLTGRGVRELIIVAQDITRYGTDLYGGIRLTELLTQLCTIHGLEWIRLHYLYPDAIDDELVRLIASEPKILKYLDIPIQHINSAVLKRMNRRGSGEQIRELFSSLRKAIPGLVLRTSLIAGLPGEGEYEFEELCDFLSSVRIERAGVFQYSPEDGTPAALMDMPDADTARRRAELLGLLSARIADEWSEGRVGNVERVLCEGFDRDYDCWYGRSYAESPDIDGRIFFRGRAEPGDFITVHITAAVDGELLGEVVEG